MQSDDGEGIEKDSTRIAPGQYEVMVVDVTPHVGGVSDQSDPGGAELSLVVLKGPLKGQVVDLGYPSDDEELLGLLGAHGTLTARPEGLSLRLED